MVSTERRHQRNETHSLTVPSLTCATSDTSFNVGGNPNSMHTNKIVPAATEIGLLPSTIPAVLWDAVSMIVRAADSYLGEMASRLQNRGNKSLAAEGGATWPFRWGKVGRRPFNMSSLNKPEMSLYECAKSRLAIPQSSHISFMLRET